MRLRRFFSFRIYAVVIIAMFGLTSLPQGSSKNMTNDLTDPSIVIRKSERKLDVFDGKKLVSSFPIKLGFTPIGDKVSEGDGKTPEGDFYIFIKNTESRFHLSLGVSYPSIADAKRGLAVGLIGKSEHDEIVKAIGEFGMPPQKTKLGGEIYIHGGGTERDWTGGCIALNDDDMTRLFELIPKDTKVTILP